MTKIQDAARGPWPLGRWVAALAVALIVSGAARPAAAGVAETRVGADARASVALTVYDNDLALVAERRRVALAAGENRLAFEDVSTGLRPETVLLRGDGLGVMEQSFAFDLITPRRLLEASVGKEVRVVETHPQTGEETVLDARLLGIAEGPVLQIGDRIETSVPGRLVFARVPEDLRERPTLLATVTSAKAGDAEIALSYLTGGLAWRADYVAELNAAEDGMSLTGFVTLTNRSGVGFENAGVHLVAGSVNRVQDRGPVPQARAMMEAAGAAAMAPAVAPPQSVSDRYLYALARPVSLADRESKQVTLLTADAVAVRREFRFETLVNAQGGAEEIGPVSAAIVLTAQNRTETGLGRPLPAGIVRAYRTAEDGTRLFVGEDRIAHTPEGGEFELTLGGAFDVTGKARRTAFERISNRSYETAQEITVKNAKDEAVEVKVIGDMPAGWRMLEESARHEAKTADRLAWTLAVAAKGEAVLTYRVRVSR